MKVTILGSGTSTGVPRIGADGPDWGECDPLEPKNRRRRVSILVEHGGVRVLVDTSPDLREQLLSAKVGRLDAVLITHDHADHSHGIDDLRQVFHNLGHPVDCYAAPQTWKVLEPRFRYVFTGGGGYPATARAHPMPPELVLGALRIRGFRQNHGPIDSLGFRFEAAGRVAAYSTDIKYLYEESWDAVEGVDLWVVDAVRRHPHPTHSHLEATLEMVARARPARALLTHMDQSMDYRTLCAALPAGIEPAYDGQVVNLGDG